MMYVMEKWRRERELSGRHALANAQYHARAPEARLKSVKRWNHSTRKRAHSLCRKYGVPLSFYDDLGWYPPDIQGVLNGSHQSQATG